MLRVDDDRNVVHCNKVTPSAVSIPSRREAMAAFERILDRVEDIESGDLYADLGLPIQTLQLYLATR